MNGYLIHSPLQYYAQKTPDHAAMRYQGNVISYKTLDLASNRLAHALIDKGAKPQDRVGIFLHKGFDLGIAIYGILKAGCVFVPLDPLMPVDRLAFILDDCNIDHVVSSDGLKATILALDPSRDIRVYGAVSDLPFKQTRWTEIDQLPDSCPAVSLIDQDLGYIMYTSGSTGTPKGMMHTHHGSITYARWGAAHVQLDAADRVASHAPLHFDLSIFDFFSTLQVGATVVLVSEAVTRFPASWTKTIEDEKISVVFTVPYTLITMFEQGAIDKRDLSSLRWILYGGEPYPPKKLGQLMEALDQVNFTNVYGPAEAPSCTCYDISRPLPDTDEPIPIGTVSQNSADLIIDDNNIECDVGSSGELCIRSSTLTKGYWNRPDLNADAFLLREGPGPFPIVYFRTGDRVVRHADGLLRFLGRMDRMIKTRGHRVELDEVEAILASHENIAEAAAIAVPDDLGSQNIAAAVSLRNNTTMESSELLKYARTKLPPYAVPRAITILDSLPHTSSEKIDRRALLDQWSKN